jgi:uncharacterized protein (TIGR02145 family)
MRHKRFKLGAVEKSILFSVIMFFGVFGINAQTDTMYVIKSGVVVGKYNVNTQVDSVIFYKPQTQAGNTPNDVTADKLATVLTIQDGAAEIYADTFSATLDSVRAINAAGQWLLNQPEVNEVYYWTTFLLDIHFKNGLKSSLLVIKEDENGQSLYRGGNDGGASIQKSFPSFSVKREKIRNNKVLVLNPFEDEFEPGGRYTKKSHFNGGPEELDVTIVNRYDVTYDVLNTFGDYGFIILNTHGQPGSFCLSKFLELPAGEKPRLWMRQEILDLITGSGVPLEKFENDELLLDMLLTIKSRGAELWRKEAVFSVTDKFIRNAPFNLEGTVIFGNHCYSGYTANGTTSNLADAYRSKGAVAYYGYAYPDNSSGAVDNLIANSMEDTLIRSLAKDGDTTGIAHLKNNSTIQWSRGVEQSNAFPVLANRGGLVFKPEVQDPNKELRFVLFYEENYGYGKCGDTITDSRDGQKYPTVCIGEQVWMAKNLNWAGSGECYDGSSANCDTYGRLYTIQELTGTTYSETNPSGIQGICPKYWHVPSEAEWQEMVDFTGAHISDAADLLRSTNLWPADEEGTDAFGFKMLPGGYVNIGPTYHFYTDLGQYAHIWTSSSSRPNTPKAIVIGPSFFVYLGYQVQTSPHYDWKFSCRCVKD